MARNTRLRSKKVQKGLLNMFLSKEKEIREALMKQAKKGEPIGYKDFCKSLFLPFNVDKLSAVLNKIAQEEGRPFLNTVVINKHRKKPGDGFFNNYNCRIELIKTHGNLSDRELYKKELEELFKKYS